MRNDAQRQSLQSLEIELEDVGSTSWWASVMTTLATQSGSAYMRFVGRTADEGGRPAAIVARGPLFSRPRSAPDDVPPDESFCPGMNRALEDLRRKLEEDGWRPAGRGEHPWSFQYVRPRPRAE